jgi:mRNA-degrading endonuclease RelE of RelBE toxin-antitoxin system
MYSDQWAGKAARFYERLGDDERDAVDAAVTEICENPLSGTPLGGNLAGKWKVKSGLYRYKLRLIYDFDPQSRALRVLVLDRRDQVYRYHR